jgi:tetratricopeptide (TPR) repeat protein
LAKSPGLADTLDSLGVVASGKGDYDTAERWLRESLEHYEDDVGAAWVHADLARVALAKDDLRVAHDHAESALSTGQNRVDLAVVAWAHNYLGLVATGHRDFAAARRHLDESLKLVLVLGDLRPQALALEGFAVLAAEADEPERAVLLAAAAEMHRVRAGIPRTATDKAILDRSLTRAEDALGSRAETVTASGRALSMDQAVALARAE